MISFNSYGEWVPVVSAQDIEGIAKDMTYFVDKDTINKKDGFTYFWELIDFGTTWSDGAMSSTSFFEGDCSLNRKRSLSTNVYDKPMGKGKNILRDNKSREWQYAPPKSNNSVVMEYVCDAR
jgi:hypothetical protein